jgi:RHH-type transcriptional regulator, proline utilization regulon repressor / proline dehydrogenase / delta 1-pyrroline-5-carboxylate dehydrogenase
MTAMDSSAALTQWQEKIDQAFLADETTCVQNLLQQAQLSDDTSRQISAKASALVQSVRNRKIVGIESFLHQYDLSTREGVLLMCVAEALLRIPDAVTADALIRDKFSQGNWQQHVGRSDSWLVNASTWGMLLAGRLSSDMPAEKNTLQQAEKLFARMSEPVARQAIRAAMGIMAEQFVMGADIDSAVSRSRKADYKQYRYSFDMLGEAALGRADAEKYFAAYQNAIETLAKNNSASQDIFSAPSISIKLSALHPRFEPLQKNRVMQELTPRVLTLAQQARDAGIGLTLDAEEAERLDLQLSVFIDVFNDKKLANWNGFGLAVQAYQKRAPFVIEMLVQVAQQNGKRILLRLVKGAYWDTEIKRAQMQGLAGYPVYTRKASTDVAYLACANLLLKNPQAFYAQFATHNAHTVAYILQQAGDRRDFEFQRLHGMGEALHDEVLKQVGRACRVYAPVGEYADLLPYLVRRLLENGANTSFVNRIADETVSLEKVVIDPVGVLRAMKSIPNPRIALPQDLFSPERKNSAGLSFADAARLRKLKNDLSQAMQPARWRATPLVIDVAPKAKAQGLTNPSNRQQEIGSVVEASSEEVEAALNSASRSADQWNAVPAARRAEILEGAADLLEAQHAELIALLVREAGKTVPDALSELREAVDFSRFYAAQARKLFDAAEILPGPTGESNQLSLHQPVEFPVGDFCRTNRGGIGCGQ